MQRRERTLEQRTSLPLPSAALVIDTRGLSDDDVIDWLQIEINDLTDEMKLNNVRHWRYLNAFLSFNRLTPQSETVHHSAGNTQAPKLSHGLTGNYFSPYEEEEDVSDAAENVPPPDSFDTVNQQLNELVQEIDRIRTNRVAASEDKNIGNSFAVSTKDATVRVIFLTNATQSESLTSAAQYAELLKDYYHHLERPGYPPLISTVVLCLGNRGEAGPPTDLIHGLQRNQSWDHIDSLILSEDYRKDAALISGTMQAYIAELLLYVLLIIPPLAVSSLPVDTLNQAQNHQGNRIALPRHTFVAGLASIEHSSRWGKRWLNFSLASVTTELLLQKPEDAQQEKNQIQRAAQEWLQRWYNRVSDAVPDHVPGEIPALQGIYKARQAANPIGPIFTTNFSLDVGNRTINDLKEYLASLTSTYTLSSRDPSLQTAVLQTTPQVMQALHNYELKGGGVRNTTTLGSLQIEAEQVVAHPDLLTEPIGAIPRACQLLVDISTQAHQLFQPYRSSPLHAPNTQEDLRDRNSKLQNLGDKMIEELQKHIKSLPFFSSLFFLKQTFAILSLLLILFMSLALILLGGAWVHHVLPLPQLDLLVNNTPAFVVAAWSIALLCLLAELAFLTSRLTNKQRSPLQVESLFVFLLLVFGMLGWLMNFSLAALDSQKDSAYISWLYPLPAWSIFFVGLSVLILLAEVGYFFWWLSYLRKERLHIVGILRTQHNDNLKDITDFIADDVALAILKRAELIDGQGGTGKYFTRLEELQKLLAEVSRQVERQKNLAANRLNFIQKETQQTSDTVQKRNRLNLHIRDERLDVATLTDEFLRLKNLLIDHDKDTGFYELTRLLLCSEGAQRSNDLPQQLAAQSLQMVTEQSQLQSFTMLLIAVALRFAVDPHMAGSFVTMSEYYKSIDPATRQAIPALQSLIHTINARSNQAALGSSFHDPDEEFDDSQLYSDMATESFSVWGQLFWKTNSTKLDQVLTRESVLSQITKVRGNDNDPMAIMSNLLSNTVPFGRNLKHRLPTDRYLLLPPSAASYRFRQGLKGQRLPDIIDFPDLERLLLLHIQPYVAEELLAVDAPKDTTILPDQDAQTAFPLNSFDDKDEAEDVPEGSSSNGHIVDEAS